jgi:hypothetical protein
VSRNFGEKRLTGVVFLHVAMACDTVWVDGLFYRLTILNFPPYLATTISSYVYGRTFEASFQSATSTRGMLDGVAQGGNNFPPVLFSLYVNDMPTPSHRVENQLDELICGSLRQYLPRQWRIIEQTQGKILQLTFSRSVGPCVLRTETYFEVKRNP